MILIDLSGITKWFLCRRKNKIGTQQNRSLIIGLCTLDYIPIFSADTMEISALNVSLQDALWTHTIKACKLFIVHVG